MALEGKIKVAIADDHPLIREGIKRLIEKTADILFVGEACNGQEAIELVRTGIPDLLILDLQMPVMDGIQVLEHLQKKSSKVIVLILSGQDDLETVRATLSMGARGYYLKEDAPNYLIQGIRGAINGERKSLSPRFSDLGLDCL